MSSIHDFASLHQSVLEHIKDIKELARSLPPRDQCQLLSIALELSIALGEISLSDAPKPSRFAQLRALLIRSLAIGSNFV